MNATTFQVYGGKGFRCEAANIKQREQALLDAVREAARRSDVLLFPAGFFCVKERGGVRRVASKMHSALRDVQGRALVVFGIDVVPSDGKAIAKASSSNGKLNCLFYVVVSSSREDEPLELQQVSATSTEEPLAPGPLFSEQRRLLGSGSRKIGLLICGEVWSPSIRATLAAARPMVILHPAHQGIKTGAGPRSWSRPIMDLATTSRATTILAEHTRSPEGRPHSWPKSVPDDGHWVEYSGTHMFRTQVEIDPPDA